MLSWRAQSHGCRAFNSRIAWGFDSRIERQACRWRKWWWVLSALLFQRPRNSSSSCGTHYRPPSRLCPMISVFMTSFVLELKSNGLFFVASEIAQVEKNAPTSCTFYFAKKMPLAEWHSCVPCPAGRDPARFGASNVYSSRVYT